METEARTSYDVSKLANEVLNLPPTHRAELERLLWGSTDARTRDAFERSAPPSLGGPGADYPGLDRLKYGGESAQTAQPGNYLGGPSSSRAEELTLENIGDAMAYHPWNGAQLEAGDQVRDTLVTAAKAIIRNVPRSPLRTRALNALVDCRMLANGAITFRGRF